MSKRKIAKIVLTIGAGLIGILLVLFLYVSSKVKNEFEEKINIYFSSLNNGSYKVEYKPFECKGFLNYECASKQIDIFVDNEKLLVAQDFIVGLNGIKTDSLKEYARGNIMEVNSTLFNFSDSFKPFRFEFKSEDKILNKREGIVLGQSSFKLETKSASYVFDANIRRKSKEFANKNIIKIILQVPLKTFLEDTEYFVEDIGAKVFSHNLKEATFSFLRQINNAELDEIEYERAIDNQTQTLIFGAKLFGFLDTPYEQQIAHLIEGYNNLLKDKIKSIQVSFYSKDEIYFKQEYFNRFQNPNDLQRFLAKFFNHYDMKVVTK